MIEVGRNEPCPCGSGKKYKKCHGNPKVVAFPTQLVDEELNQLLNKLNEYTYTHYGFHVPRVPAKTNQKLFNLMAVLHTSLFRPLQNGKRIIEEYIEDKGSAVKRPATKQSFEQWSQAEIGIFHLDAQPTESLATMRNTFTGHTFTIQMNASESLDMSYFIGMIGAWGEYNRFLPFSMPMEENTYKRYIASFDKEYEAHHNGQGRLDYFSENFLNQLTKLSEIMKNPIQEDAEEQWEGKPEEHEVMNLLDERVDRNIFSEEEITHIKQFWMAYCDNHHPTIRKPEVFAATLEYFFGTDSLFGPAREVTQKGLGTKYGVSPNTISKRTVEVSGIFHNMFEQGQAQ
ncbi:YecA family protein [Pontibacillus salicampi]|uniref:YecA family protein n=1 Tax=Pontibacillus salicampi TaxID=1449801 RepID=A0ABV6LSH0_9BACI